MAITTSDYNPDSQSLVVNKSDAVANDSDKSFTVPDGKTWEISWAHLELTSTATAGNRQLDMAVLDDDNVEVLSVQNAALQAASLLRHYAFMQGIYRETSFSNGAIQVPLPQKLILHPGWTIRFYDSAAIDAAADDMTVFMQVLQRDT